MKRMNVSTLTLAAWPPSQSLHLRRHTTPGSQAPSLSLSLSYCWAEAQQHQVTAGPVVQTTGGTPAACQYLSRGTQLALRDALDLILTRYLASYAAGPSPADHYYHLAHSGSEKSTPQPSQNHSKIRSTGQSTYIERVPILKVGVQRNH